MQLNEKKTPLDIIREIETTFPVETITARNIQVWPYVRIYLFAIGGDPYSVKKTSLFRTFITSFFYGFSNLFRKFDVLLFSDTKERRKIVSLYHDKSVDYLAETLPRSLVIEIPLPAHYSKKAIPTKHIISKVFFYFIETVYAKIFLLNLKVKNKEILDDILEKYELDLNYRSIIKRLVSQYVISRKIAHLFRPRAAFIECYYTNIGRIIAFREKGIKVIEIQHGVISNEHLAYNFTKKFDEKYFPEYLLTFGESEAETAKNDSFYIHAQNVLPAGSFYIDYLNSNPVYYPEIDKYRSKYKYLICVSGQNHYTEPLLMDFLNKAARLSSEILFIFVPRDNSFDKSKYHLSNNIIINSDLNCYEMISLCDFHSTVYSTCALEAPSLGIPNILINIDGLSKLHYGKVLNNTTTTLFADSPEEFIQSVKNYTFTGKSVIRDLNRHIIKPGYKENIQKILKEISLL